MFKAILTFEIRQHLKKAFTWVFLILMTVQGLYYMHHAGEFYSADKTYANAPAIIYTVLAGVGYIGFIVTAILGGAALGKDIDNRTSALFYTTRAGQVSFFGGRYLGSLAVLFFLYAGYMVGIVLYNYLPVPNLGPFAWSALGRAFLLIFLPNVFVLYSLCFAVTVFTKSGKTAYAVALFGMLLMIFAETTFDSNPYVVLADPTGFSVLHNQLEHLSPAEKNAFSPAFKGLLLYNRLMWVCFSLFLLLLAGWKFSFSVFSSGRQEKTRKQLEENTAPTILAVHGPLMSKKVHQDFSVISRWKRVISLSWLEFKSVIRPVGFRLFLSVILVIYICYIAVWQQQYYSAAPTLPVTLEITGVTLPLSFYFLLFLIINTVELLFRNNVSGFWQIGDALPVPSWVSILSKVVAMLGVSLLMVCCLMLFGMLVQLAKGYHHVEPAVYLSELFIRWIPKYLLYILLTVFVAGLTANRYATHWICVLTLVISTVLHEIEIIEQHRLNFMFSPGGGMTTDMNGDSIFGPAHIWFMGYWLSLSSAMLALGLWLWQRGTPASLLRRIKSKKISPALLVLFLAGLSGFFLFGSRIYQTINIQNKFQNKEEVRAEQALYERTYKRYEHDPRPLIRNVRLNLDLYPKKREVHYMADLAMSNLSKRPITDLHLEWMDFSAIDSLAIEGYALSLVQQDTVLRHSIYSLDHPILPGDSVICHAIGHLRYEGFTNDDPQKALTFNGSFLSQNIVPFFGYDDRRELKSNQYRIVYGLPKLNGRLPSVSDSLDNERLFASSQANRIHYTLSISTDSGQTIVAPGQLAKKWRSDKRNYVQFVNERPALYNFSILSARYEVKRQQVDVGGKAVQIEVFYHPDHAYNVDHFISSAKEALSYLDSVIGPYPYSTLRIAERPHYDEELSAYGNVIVLPENHGWIADIRRAEDLDYLRYVTTRLIGEQYMQQINVRYAQGYPVITRSIPGYLALQQLRHFYGDDALRNRLQKSMDLYVKGRAKEDNTEPVLIKSDEQANYVSEEKGSLVLYHLSQLAGEGLVSHVVRSFLDTAKVAVRPVSADQFYRQLSAAVGEKNEPFLKMAFERLDLPKLDDEGSVSANQNDEKEEPLIKRQTE